MGNLDIIIFIVYGVVIIVVGNWLARSKSKERSSADYFFANKSLPWFLVGSSIIAANISAEQFIGMSGSGFAIGLGIATYEWIAALILIVVAKYFLPVFIEKKIFTMPQFLALRYDNRIKTILAIFWLGLFIFVNLTSILYLGALALKSIFGIKLIYGIIGLAVFSLLYTVVNGLKAIASTDIIQVFFLLIGGLVTTWFAVNHVGGNTGIINGFETMFAEIPEKFHMIIKKSDPNYFYLPGIRAIIGGIWIAGIYYFGANQYIIQKAFGAKSLKEAQKGMVFAGYLKMILPFVVVIPGIVAFALSADIAKPDEAYPWILENIVPAGIKGLIFAALIAAIVSSFSAIINSTSTIFTMDLYKPYFNKNATEKRLVAVGRISGIVAMGIAVIVAPLLGSIDQAFQFIQEYTGMISPGVTAIFVFGMFWKRTTSTAALWGTILSIPVSAALKFIIPEMPFLDQMLVSFVIISVIIVIISLLDKKGNENKGLEISRKIFRTDNFFNILSIIIIIIFSAIYIVFW
ncbi:MAG: sodium/solute symporter [Prolixibacteraceae bacterium]|jgi:solute:Na+ symporter, SSS family|nr:sodium/solute symporter [Prolixibacteraceae bacterium]MBT6004677.1 sodium/solute symporter [Prolixibacteraceae bacterium]MBT6765317.1 sodium/solute symporter [Prolixibacteraceae bacterium]MBT6999893.1 sodium/solute symporter [Prolixibacteraceae bacterium]MBT7396588.1 sodium/solute symporter [Prolixibacteraceae bacterium]